ncbi:MAG TPA: helix-turn-helix domain-containing protein [Baekduia sp.]|nr:helix-turn-helix domain-containing protein [Baekduia sp.]
MATTTGSGDGLRERKKRQTRAAIAAAATRLFAQRGFDGVTVAEIARAADVSEKTVFNHFPAKEDLVFAGGEERRAALIAAVRQRPAGTSVLEPFRAATLAFLDQVERGPVDEIVAAPRMVMASATLRDRLFVGWEREAGLLAPVIAEAAGVAADDVVAAVVARTLAWTHRVVVREAFQRLLAGEDQRAVAAALRADAQRAYDQLAAGLAGYGTA